MTMFPTLLWRLTLTLQVAQAATASVTPRVQVAKPSETTRTGSVFSLFAPNHPK